MADPIDGILRAKDLPGVIVLAGEEFFRLQAMDRLRERARKDGMLVVQHDWSRPSADEAAGVFDDLRSGSLFGEKKLLLIHPADKFMTASKKIVESFLEKPPAGGSLVLSVSRAPAGKAWKTGVPVLSWKKLYPNQVSAWLAEQAGAHGRRLQPAAARLLQEMLGDNLFKLDAALRKLSGLAPPGTAIQQDMVEAHIGADREATAFELQDAMTTGRSGAVLKALSYYADTELHMAVNGMIRTLRQWRGMRILLQEGMSPDDMAQKLGLHPFVVKKQLQAARSRSVQDLDRKLLLCRDIDRRIKTGEGSLRVLAESLAAALCG